jgi:hypothetical protein
MGTEALPCWDLPSTVWMAPVPSPSSTVTGWLGSLLLQAGPGKFQSSRGFRLLGVQRAPCPALPPCPACSCPAAWTHVVLTRRPEGEWGSPGWRQLGSGRNVGSGTA